MTFDGWFDAVKGGHTFVTTGPMLLLTVDGKRPGDTLDILIEYTGLAANRADLINKAFLTSATDQDAVFGDIANGATFTF